MFICLFFFCLINSFNYQFSLFEKENAKLLHYYSHKVQSWYLCCGSENVLLQSFCFVLLLLLHRNWNVFFVILDSNLASFASQLVCILARKGRILILTFKISVPRVFTMWLFIDLSGYVFAYFAGEETVIWEMELKNVSYVVDSIDSH